METETKIVNYDAVANLMRVYHKIQELDAEQKVIYKVEALEIIVDEVQKVMGAKWKP